MRKHQWTLVERDGSKDWICDRCGADGGGEEVLVIRHELSGRTTSYLKSQKDGPMTAYDPVPVGDKFKAVSFIDCDDAIRQITRAARRKWFTDFVESIKKKFRKEEPRRCSIEE